MEPEAQSTNVIAICLRHRPQDGTGTQKPLWVAVVIIQQEKKTHVVLGRSQKFPSWEEMELDEMLPKR